MNGYSVRALSELKIASEEGQGNCAAKATVPTTHIVHQNFLKPEHLSGDVR